MLHKVMSILRIMQSNIVFSFMPLTVGELARLSGKPYTSVKRWLEIAENSELVESEIRPYKSTGKRVYWITEKGFVWLNAYRPLPLDFELDAKKINELGF